MFLVILKHYLVENSPVQGKHDCFFQDDSINDQIKIFINQILDLFDSDLLIQFELHISPFYMMTFLWNSI